jgi:hypothetical protein
MKTTLAQIGVAALLVASLRADPIIVKQRAMELRNQNNVRQGVAPPSQPAHPAPTTTPTTSPTPVQQSVAKLRADLTAIKANSQVTATQKQQIAKDIIALAHGANKPSEATAAALANSLASAYATKPLSEQHTSRLLSDLAAVLNPGNIQPAQMQAIHSDIQAIFQSNGMARNDVVKLVDQVKAAGSEAK